MLRKFEPFVLVSSIFWLWVWDRVHLPAVDLMSKMKRCANLWWSHAHARTIRFQVNRLQIRRNIHWLRLCQWMNQTREILIHSSLQLWWWCESTEAPKPASINLAHLKSFNESSSSSSSISNIRVWINWRYQVCLYRAAGKIHNTPQLIILHRNLSVLIGFVIISNQCSEHKKKLVALKRLKHCRRFYVMDKIIEERAYMS